MKRIIFILAGWLFVSQLVAQTSNVIFYTENGEKFTVILNGIRQNPTPQTNVKVTGLNARNYQVKIIFEDQALGTLDKPLYFTNIGNEYTFAVIKNKKGEYKLGYRGDVPIAQAPPSTPQQTTVVYTTVPATSTTYTESTTTSVNNGGMPAGNQGFNVGVHYNEGNGGQGGNFNVNMNPGNMNMGANAQTTTSYTTTTTTTTQANVPPQPPPAYSLPGYNGKIGCPMPMSPGDFESAKQSISSKSFEESKLTIAKQIINSNCLLTTQVKQILLLFTFENTRLDFAKYAYTRTYDQNNYFKVNDAFTFESSIDELNQYINNH